MADADEGEAAAREDAAAAEVAEAAEELQEAAPPADFAAAVGDVGARGDPAAGDAGEAQVDLAAQEVRWPGGTARFEIDPDTKHRLLNGLDDIALTLQRESLIEEFEKRRSEIWPWLDGTGYKGKRIPLSGGKEKMDW